MRFFRGNLRFFLFLLIFLAILPGILLFIYLILTKQLHQVVWALVIEVSTIAVAWLGGNLLIVRKIRALIHISERLASGDFSARSGLVSRFGWLDELTQAIDQMATSLETQTGRLQRFANATAAFTDIATELASQPDTLTLLQLIAEKAMGLFSASHASISLYDPVRDELEIAVVKGFPIPIGTRIRMGEGAVGRAAQSRQAVIIANYLSWVGRFAEFEGYPFSRVMQVPIFYQGEIVGVLGVAEIKPETSQFSPEDAQLLTLFAGQAAVAIKNGRLNEEVLRRLQELAALNDISTALRVAQNTEDMLSNLLEKTLRVFEAVAVCIWLYSSSVNALRPIASQGISNSDPTVRLGEEIPRLVFHSGEPYFSLDLKEDPRTEEEVRPFIPSGLKAAFFPISAAQSIVGVMLIGSKDHPQMTEGQIRLAKTIAEMVGSTIHRMQLFEQTRNQLERLNALHAIDLAITNSPDLGSTLQIFLEQAITRLNVDAASVLIYDPNDQTLNFGASRGFFTDSLRHTRLRLGEGYAGMAALGRKTVHIPDLKTRPTGFLSSSAISSEGFVSYYAVPLVSRGLIKGVLEIFLRSSLEQDRDWLDFLESLASQAAIVIENASLFTDLQRSNAELYLAYDTTLEGWSRALDLRDRETKGHSQRVTDLTLRLARDMLVADADLAHIRRGALLHDIGKLGIPDSILLKRGPLTDEERILIQKHPIIAHELLAPIAYLRQALDIPYCHHERWDGTGYPRGLKEDQIPLSARIFAVVDVWDALRSERPYRKSWPEEKARAYIRNQAGQHFDPVVVDAFLTLLNEEK